MRINILNQDGHLTSGFNLAGGTVNGPLELVGNPTQPMEAATKQYIDTAVLSLNAGHVLSGTLGVGRLPGFVGGDLTSLPGSNTLTLSNTAVVPGVYTKVDVNSRGRVIRGDLLNNSDIPNLSWSRVSLGRPTTVLGYGITNAATTGATVLTGFLTLHASPVAGNQLATKSYVDSAVAGVGAALSVGDMIRRPSAVTPSGFLRTNGGEVSRTTFSALFSVIGSSFDFTTMPGAGQPWEQQFDISLEPNTVLGSWSTAGNLPSVLWGSSVIVTRNRVFLLGGSNGAVNITTIFTATINADGTLGAWSTAGNIPIGFSDSSAIVTRNRVFLLGGWHGVSIATVHTASINTDGTLGSWSTAGNLPSILHNYSVVVTRNRVFLLGGVNGTASISTIFTATINADGTLGTWSTAGNLPSALGLSSIAVTRNRVFLLGGHNGTATISTIFTAPINADGTLGAWSTAGNIPAILAYSSVVVTRNRVFLLGGNSHTGTISNIFTAPINADGTLGAWTTAGNLPSALAESSVVVVKNRVFLLGGWSSIGGGIGISTIFTATINAGLNDYSPFYDGTMVPTDLTNFRLPDTTLTDPPGLFTYIRT